MSQDQTKKEALFNEVKGSLFEYLVAKTLARRSGDELSFQQGLDANYLNVLSQQDRMIRQFYPEMMIFLSKASATAAEKIIERLGEIPAKPRVTGKFSHSKDSQDIHEADLIVETNAGPLPISLKLNKKNSFVNSKSGGIKSFFSVYFPFIEAHIQQNFNQLVDMEFNRMALELHALHDMEFQGNFDEWVKKGFSELPGELSLAERDILKLYYARIAREMHLILQAGQKQNPPAFAQSLLPLMGFSSANILQVICFHEFKTRHEVTVDIHSSQEVSSVLQQATLNAFGDISSVEISVGKWDLQIRVKPMNKFTTTAIKINCSIKVRN